MYILPELTHGVGNLRGELTGPALQLPQRPRERVRVHHGVRGGCVGGGEEGKVHLREHLVQRLQTRSLGQGPVLHVHRQRLGGIHRLLRGVLEEVHALRVGGVGGKRLLAHPQRHSAGLEDKLRRLDGRLGRLGRLGRGAFLGRGFALTRGFGWFLTRVVSLRIVGLGRFRIGLGGLGRGRVLARALAALRLGLILLAALLGPLGDVRAVLGRTRVFLHGRVAVGRLLRDRGINPRFNLGRTRRG